MSLAVGRHDFPANARRLAAAFLAALLLHAAALFAISWWQASRTVNPPGEQQVTIDLAPAMHEAETVAPDEPAQAAAPDTNVVSAESPTEARKEEAEPFDVSEVATSTETTTTIAPAEFVEDTLQGIEPTEAAAVEVVSTDATAETVVAQAVPAPPAPPAPVQKPPEPRPDPMPRPTTRRPPSAAPSNASQRRQSASREDTGASAASADPNVFNRYAAQLAAALRSRLRFPDEARARGIGGSAVLRFTIDRSGRVLGASLARSSGETILDRAALATASPGSMLPAVPPGIPQQQLTFSVPLRFNIQ